MDQRPPPKINLYEYPELLRNVNKKNISQPVSDMLNMYTQFVPLIEKLFPPGDPNANYDNNYEAEADRFISFGFTDKLHRLIQNIILFLTDSTNFLNNGKLIQGREIILRRKLEKLADFFEVYRVWPTRSYVDEYIRVPQYRDYIFEVVEHSYERDVPARRIRNLADRARKVIEGYIYETSSPAFVWRSEFNDFNPKQPPKLNMEVLSSVGSILTICKKS